MANERDVSPILIVPYMWIGDFVRCHSVVQVLNERFPHRPVDMLASPLNAPIADYMPGLRKAVIADLPRGRLALARQWALARRLKAEHYGSALIMLRTWKAALAPFLAGIRERTGFIGEGRFLLLNDLRGGDRRYARMIDQFGALALPSGAPLPTDWPLPKLVVPRAEVAAWLARNGLAASAAPRVAVAPGTVGQGKRWSSAGFADVARSLAGDGIEVWVLGGPNEKEFAREIVAAAGNGGAPAIDLTGNDLRNAILALAAVDVAVTNDSGLMHVAAALATPTVALFGPTDPRLWAPLNPLAAALEPPRHDRCPQCGTVGCANVRHRRIDDIAPGTVVRAVRTALGARPGRG